MTRITDQESELLTLNDELWERLIDLTGGSAALCYQCGVCTATCPWGTVREEPLSVRKFMRMAQLGVKDGNENLWLCTTCGQCHHTCPRGVDICQVFRALRAIAWEQGAVEHGLPSLLWSEFWNGNPWTQPPSQRTAWTKNKSLPVFDPAAHEVLLYVGCTASYDQRAQGITQALLLLFEASGVRFGYLGEEEPCCGEAVLSVGHLEYFREIARKTLVTFQDHGVSTLVTISPHCYDVFKNHYPSDDPASRLQVFHYTQYLALLLDEGRLSFGEKNPSAGNKKGKKIITFQDPCYLGRHNQEYESPRKILNAIPDIELVEMHHHKETGLCCGGGGGRMWLETDPGERFSDLRATEFVQTGAEVLATACPFCVVCMEDSVKGLADRDRLVLDIAEIASEALKA